MSKDKKAVIDIETASAEFDRWAEAMDLELDTALMDADDLNGFTRQKNRIVRAIERGALVVNDDGEAQYTPQNAKSKHQDAITFHERTGLTAMDGAKKNQDMKRTYAVMGEMCKVHPNVFASNLVGIDIKVCEAIFSLLMD